MKRKKKLLLISPNSINSNCGVAKYTYYLAGSLKYKYDVKILTEKSKILSKDVLQLNSWNLSEFFNYIGIIKKFKPDIIHIQLAEILLNKGFLVSLIPLISIHFKPLSLFEILKFTYSPCIKHLYLIGLFISFL